MTLYYQLFQSEFSVLPGRLIRNMFPLHICQSNDYTIEISVLLQIQFYNISSKDINFQCLCEIFYRELGQYLMQFDALEKTCNKKKDYSI